MTDERDGINETELEESLRFLDTFSHPEPDSNVLASVQSAVRDELSARRRRRIIFRLTAPIAAAAACILLAVGLWAAFPHATSTDVGQDRGYAHTTTDDPVATLVKLFMDEAQTNTEIVTTADNGTSTTKPTDETIPEDLDYMLWELTL